LHTFGLSKSTGPVLKPSRSPFSFLSDHPACCVLVASPHFCAYTLFGMPGGTTIIMAAHNNRDILMVPYEDLPNEDNDVISKAIEEF